MLLFITLLYFSGSNQAFIYFGHFVCSLFYANIQSRSYFIKDILKCENNLGKLLFSLLLCDFTGLFHLFTVAP